MTDFQRGDRVRLKGVSIYGSNAGGKSGVIVSQHVNPAVWFVRPDGAPSVAYLDSQMEHIFEVGDRVVIVDTQAIHLPERLKGSMATVTDTSATVISQMPLRLRLDDGDFISAKASALCPLRKEDVVPATVEELNDHVWRAAKALQRKVVPMESKLTIDRLLADAGIVEPRIGLPADIDSVIWVEPAEGAPGYAVQRTGRDGWLSTRDTDYFTNAKLTERLRTAEKWTVLR